MALRQHAFLIGFGLLLLLSGCRWEEADRFAGDLRCGMSPDEVRALAERYGTESFRPAEEPDGYVTHVLNEKSTFFELYFSRSGLETVRQGTHRGLTRGEYSPRLNLCTGEQTRSVEVTLRAPQPWAGATVHVDGKEVATLSPQAYRTILVPNGRHEIRIHKNGYKDVVIPVIYEIEATKEEITIPKPEPG